MEIIRRADLREIIARRNGPQFATIMACTQPRMVKADNPFYGNVFKWAVVNGMVSWNYGNSVNNQRCREGRPQANGQVLFFTPAARVWGHRSGPFVCHNGQEYLELKVQKSLGYQYMDRQGNLYNNEQINPFLPHRQEGRRQQVMRPVICRDYSLDNIFAITINNQTYTLQ